jgi:hypothetical protein
VSSSYNPRNHRNFHRIFFNAEAKLCYGENAYPCEILDLSLKGCLLNFDQGWSGESDHLYKLILKLSDEVSIVMEVSVVHAVGNRIGFRCEHIDIDSMSNLRRLVELNLGNSELLERELTGLSDLNAE